MNILFVDVIFEYFALIIIFLLSIYLYVMLAARLLPRLLLVPSLGPVQGDRGIKKSVFPGGRSVAYEPKLSVRGYVKQYVLFSENGEKYIKCKIDEKIRTIRYDVVVYDRKNTPISTVEISETVAGDGFTASVMLPPETSFVHLRLIRVNDTPVADAEVCCYRGSFVVLFFLAAFGLSLAEGLYINYFVLKMLELIFSFSQHVTSYDNTLPLLAVAVISAVIAAVTVFINIEKPYRIVGKK